MSPRRVVAALLLAGVAASLLAGMLGGLFRLGIVLPALTEAPWLGRAAPDHAALMMGGFLGTVIGIERAVAARQRLAWSAPVILPAIARVKLAFGGFFYLPLAALHLTLLLRPAAGFADFPARRAGALGNALAMALFALTVAAAARAWRRRHGGRPSTPELP